MKNFISENADNTTKAVEGLDIFTKNWCMDCKETEKQEDLVFRCSECEFSDKSTCKCLIKVFAGNHEHNYPLNNFGSMGEH